MLKLVILEEPEIPNKALRYNILNLIQISMAGEPTTTEEYIQIVQRQAEEQSNDKVVSHQELRESFEKEKKYYMEKMKFYSLLLLVIVLSYIAVKLFPVFFSDGQSGSQ